MLTKLKSMLIRHEADKRFPYKDSEGILSIGIGHNLESKPFSDDAVDLLYEEDINDVLSDISRNFDWYARLNDARKAVIISMVFNMGVSRFKGFKKTIKLIEHRNFSMAAKEMLISRWSDQVGQRAVELSKMMETGKW